MYQNSEHKKSPGQPGFFMIESVFLQLWSGSYQPLAFFIVGILNEIFNK